MSKPGFFFDKLSLRGEVNGYGESYIAQEELQFQIAVPYDSADTPDEDTVTDTVADEQQSDGSESSTLMFFVGLVGPAEGKILEEAATAVHAQRQDQLPQVQTEEMVVDGYPGLLYISQDDETIARDIYLLVDDDLFRASFSTALASQQQLENVFENITKSLSFFEVLE